MSPHAVVLLGAGREAAAAARYYFAAAPQTHLYAYDDAPQKALAFASEHPGVRTATIDDVTSALAGALWLRAPSLPPDHPLVQRAREIGAQLTTYLGFWLQTHESAVLATITGTKGKSSTTTMATQILQRAGLDVRAGGNIGVVPDRAPQGESWILETSSYQLHDMPAAARLHALTSVFPEHLDWHGGFDNYVQDKLRPYTLRPSCVGVLPKALAPYVSGLSNTFHYVEDAVRIDGARLQIERGDVRAAVSLSDTATAKLASDNILNATFSTGLAIAAHSSAIPLGDLARAATAALENWTGLPSRQQIVGEFGRRTWVDDSLATIPQATIAALKRWRDRPVRLIVGGRDRHQDFDSLLAYLDAAPQVKVYGYGPSVSRIAARLARHEVGFKSFEETIAGAFAESQPGDLILFSPAGATPEAGASYEDRSRIFAAFAKSVS